MFWKRRKKIEETSTRMSRVMTTGTEVNSERGRVQSDSRVMMKPALKSGQEQSLMGASRQAMIREAVRVPKAMPKGNAVESISEGDLALEAYSIWQCEGCPEGRALDHWMLARKRLMKSMMLP